MIAYLLLRMAAKTSRSTLSALRFRELAGQRLFTRKPLCAISTATQARPLKPKASDHLTQGEFAYA